MGAKGLFRGSGSFTMNTVFEFVPINGGFHQIKQVDSRYRWVLISYCLFGITSPSICSRNPKPLSKACTLHLLVFEFTARSRKETVNRRFVNRRAFLIAFALNSPIVSFMC